MASKPTQRCNAELKKRGWRFQVVEHWVSIPNHPGGGVRRDLFGFIDILVIKPDGKLLAIQATGGSGSHAHRRRKILGECREAAEAWLSHPGRELAIWSWNKRGSRGQRKVWTLREETITLPLGPAPD